MKNSTIVLDAMNPGDETFLKFLTSNKVNIKIVNMVGPSGWPEVKLTGTKANLTNVLQAEDGWGDPSLATFIEDAIH
tara:strand:- start:355 stop:585 length:231 start_codon:yes stop_codon:yes gene_type:complete